MKQKLLQPKEKERLIENFGQWAVVTGASSGIGLELATRLAEAGFNLVINSRTKSTLQKIQIHLQSTYDVKVETIAADVGTDEGVREIMAAASGLNLGLFVAAAGFGTSGRLVNSNIDEEANLLQLNCIGLLKLTYHFGRLFAFQRRGGIILLSSIVAFQGVPYSANYAASKAYVQSLAEGLSRELKPFNVHVLAAAPGPVSSGFGERANMKMGMTLDPSVIAIPILHALGRKTTVLPGLFTKVIFYSLSMLPRWGKVRAMEKVMYGFTKHQQAAIR